MSKFNLGIVLIILGIIALSYQGFTYTKREKVIDAGPIQISADHDKTVSFPPLLGGLVLGAGVLLIVTSKRD